VVSRRDSAGTAYAAIPDFDHVAVFTDPDGLGVEAHRGRKVGVMINPLDAPTQTWTGITGPVANELVSLYDYTTIWLWARNAQGSLPASYARQLELLRQGGTVDGRRVLALFELAETSEEDARFVHDAIRRDGLAGAMLWRNRAVQGGPCDSPVNRKTALLVFGRLPGETPEPRSDALM
jgi:hypothetical protein